MNIVNSTENNLLNRAYAFHRNGQLARAEDAYKNIVQKNPRNTMAAHALGTLYYQQGKNKLARKYITQAIKTEPGIPDFHYNLGLVYMAMSDHTRAINAYKKAIEINHHHIQARVNLAQVYSVSEMQDEALSEYHRIIDLDPGHSDALMNLGNIYAGRDQYDEALGYLEQSVAISPESVEANYNLGIVLIDLKRYKEAIERFQVAIHKDKYFQQAYLAKGTALDQLARPRDAIETYRLLIAVKPDCADAYNLLGQTLYEIGADDAAISILETGLGCASGDIDLKYQLAHMYQKAGKVDAAMELYDEILEIQPDNLGYVAGKSTLYEKMGDYESALHLIEPYLKDGVYAASIGIAFASIARHFKQSEQAINYINAVLGDTQAADVSADGQHNQAYIDLYFHLGKLHDSLGNYDKAFDNFRKYNDSQNATPNYDQFSRVVEDSVNQLGKEMMVSLPKSSVCTSKPVFIVGMPRSGTSLAEQILSAHSCVEGAGELPDIGEISDYIADLIGSEKGYPACLTEIDQGVLDAVAERYLNTLNEKSATALYVTDKMPHNFAHIGLIRLMFPEAKIIHCRRDPIDSCLSIYFNQFNRTHAYATDLTALGGYYLRYQLLMAHWNKVYDGEILDHCYEDLIENQEDMTRRLLAFCNLDWEPDCMQFFKTERVVNTMSYDQVRQPIYRESVARWRKYEEYLAPLIEALGKAED